MLSPPQCPALSFGGVTCSSHKGKESIHSLLSLSLSTFIFTSVCLPDRSPLPPINTHTHSCSFLCLYSVFFCICICLSIGLPGCLSLSCWSHSKCPPHSGTECAFSGPMPDPGERSALKIQLGFLTKPHCSYA